MNFHIFWIRRNDHITYGHSCVGRFIKSSDSFDVFKENSKMFIRLSRSNHKLACNQFLNDNRDNKELVFQKTITDRTLIQGRLCYVYSIEIAPKKPGPHKRALVLNI